MYQMVTYSRDYEVVWAALSACFIPIRRVLMLVLRWQVWDILNFTISSKVWFGCALARGWIYSNIRIYPIAALCWERRYRVSPGYHSISPDIHLNSTILSFKSHYPERVSRWGHLTRLRNLLWHNWEISYTSGSWGLEFGCEQVWRLPYCADGYFKLRICTWRLTS
jgi:hypothetical protein